MLLTAHRGDGCGAGSRGGSWTGSPCAACLGCSWGSDRRRWRKTEPLMGRSLWTGDEAGPVTGQWGLTGWSWATAPSCCPCSYWPIPLPSFGAATWTSRGAWPRASRWSEGQSRPGGSIDRAPFSPPLPCTRMRAFHPVAHSSGVTGPSAPGWPGYFSPVRLRKCASFMSLR
jgi:hypothetical protein